jgi:hypothetical protein
LPHVPEGVRRLLRAAGQCAFGKLTWTRGEPTRFRSSNHVSRGFCKECGTPLTYEAPGCVAISIGAFDQPEELAPAVQWGIEEKLPYVDGCTNCPATPPWTTPRTRHSCTTSSTPTSTPITTPTNGRPSGNDMSAKEQIYLFDTTLRDGAQTPGIDFSVEDKIAIARMLDEFGLDYVEGGYPGANPTDTEFFGKKRTRNATFVAFGMTKRAGVSASNDPGLAALLQSQSDAICFVAKSWDYHVRLALGCTNEENLESISASVEAAIASAKEAMVDCEHFFDGYKANPDYALACAKAAYDAGARWVVLCDTNGGTQPDEVRQIVAAVMRPASRATGSASTPMTIPARRSPIRWRPSMPACGRCRARSTASASAAATPTSSPSSRP